MSALAPLPVAAHPIGQVFTLPVPLALYLTGAGVAVAASFVVSVVVAAKRVRRFGKLLAFGTPAPAALTADVETLAHPCLTQRVPDRGHARRIVMQTPDPPPDGASDSARCGGTAR